MLSVYLGLHHCRAACAHPEPLQQPCDALLADSHELLWQCPQCPEGLQVPPDPAGFPIPILETLPQCQLCATVSAQAEAALCPFGSPVGLIHATSLASVGCPGVVRSYSKQTVQFLPQITGHLQWWVLLQN